MAKIQNNPPITTNGAVLLGKAHKKRDMDKFFALFYCYGTFGGGTITWGWSPDQGTTIIPMYDLSNVAITSTANDGFTSDIATGSSNNDPILFYATLAGATAPSITVGYYDNCN